MNKILSFCCPILFLLFVTQDSYTQENDFDSELHGIKIQTGLFYDWAGFTNYGGFRKGIIGYSRFKDQLLTEFSVEASQFSTIGPVFLEQTSQIIGGEDRQNLLVEFEIFRSLTKRDYFDNQIHFGVFASALYSLDERTPYRPDEFFSSTTCYCVSAGLKAIYTKKLFKSLYFETGTKINFATFGVFNEFNSDPSIATSLQDETSFEMELLRLRVGIDLGLVFKL